MAQDIYFIDEDKNKLFDLAFKTCLEKKLPVRLIYFKNVISRYTKFDKNQIFVFSNFKGIAFNHLNALKMTILGPGVIIYCINKNIPLPSFEKPIYSMIMFNTKISTSKVSKEEQLKLFDMIEMMGGNISRDLTDSVDVLLTSDVTSSKYHMAHSCKMHVFRPQWIYSLWTLCSIKPYIEIFNSIITKPYYVPVLFNLSVSLSGFDLNEKKQYIEMINVNGGLYCGDLKNVEGSILITKNTDSDKYKYAILWKLTIVTILWLQDSISRGFCQRFSEYSFRETKSLNDKSNNVANNPLTTISIPIKENKGIFVNCRVCFVACSENFVDNWTKVIKSEGGAICAIDRENFENVTHIVVGNDLLDVDISLYKSRIRMEWLEKCLEKKQLLPVYDFLIKDAILLNESWIWEEENFENIEEVMERKNIMPNIANLVNDFDVNEKFESMSLEEGDKEKDTSFDADDFFEEDNSDTAKNKVLNVSVNADFDEFTNEYLEAMSDFESEKDELTNEDLESISDFESEKGELTNEDLESMSDFESEKEKEVSKNMPYEEIIFKENMTLDISKTFENDFEEEFTVDELKFIEDIESDCREMGPCTSKHNKGLFNECKVAFLDCPKEFVDKWTMIINSESGTTLTNVNDDVTCVIVYDCDTAFQRTMERPYLSKDWLQKSWEAKRLLPLDDFFAPEMLDDDTWTAAFNFENDINEHPLATNESPDKETVFLSIHSIPNGLFKDLKFFLDKMLSESSSKRLITAIANESGKLSDKPDKCNFIVTALVVRHPYKLLESVEIVTEYFISQCIAQRTILLVSDDFLYSPLLIDEKCQYILSGCVLYIVGFSPEETAELCTYSESLGAVIQKVITNKNCEKKNLKVTTHIITKAVLGNEISYAEQLNIPVVTRFWLEKCGHSRCITQIENFLARPTDVLPISVDNENKDALCKTNDEEPVIQLSTLRKVGLKRASSATLSQIMTKIPRVSNPLSKQRHGSMKETAHEVLWEYELTGDEFQVIMGSKKNENMKEQRTSTKCVKVSVVEVPIQVAEINPKKVFELSVTANERELKMAIERLGGEVVDELGSMNNVTHLVITSPNRSEKYLTAIAGCKWILHPSYIKDSVDRGSWLDEEQYEWGNPLSMYTTNKELKLALGGHMWRKQGGGAFNRWKVLLLDMTPKVDKICTILRSGGAQIISSPPHEVSIDKVTHAFYQGYKTSFPKFLLPLHFTWYKLKHILKTLEYESLTEMENIIYTPEQIKDINLNIKKHNKL